MAKRYIRPGTGAARARNRRLLWIAGGVVAAGALVGGIAYAASKQQSSNSVTNPSTVTFVTGHRYSINVVDPQEAIPASKTEAELLASLQQELDRLYPGQARIVSVTVSSDRHSFVVIVDVLGSTQSVVVPPPIRDALTQAGGTWIVSDMGPTP